MVVTVTFPPGLQTWFAHWRTGPGTYYCWPMEPYLRGSYSGDPPSCITPVEQLEPGGPETRRCACGRLEYGLRP